jgi:hypothetical protein
MPKENTSKRSGRGQTRSVEGPKTIANAERVLGEAVLEGKVLEVLKAHTANDGLSLGDLTKKCGVVWRRGLAAKQRLKRTEATATDAQGFIYHLWERGIVFAEPPAQGKRAARIWSMENARMKFPLACLACGAPTKRDHTLTQQSLKSAYDKFVPDHLGAFVPIFKVRRELAAPREEFDNLLKSLNEMDDPVLDLLGGDPQQYTEDQKQDSLWRGENLFLRMRWRGL